jgi:hypothetical protein
MNKETIYGVNWEGPFDWEAQGKYAKDHHVLYQICGAHHLYGRDVLLYIGLTSRSVADRLKEHKALIEGTYDKATVRFGSVGKFATWPDWVKQVKSENYQQASPASTQQIEALLIFAHQPVFNMKNKTGFADMYIRIFNTGRSGQLFREVSSKYYE